MPIAPVVVGTKVLGTKGNEIITEVNSVRTDLTALTALEAAHAPNMRLSTINHTDKLMIVANLAATVTPAFGPPGVTNAINFGATFTDVPTVVVMGANGADVTVVLNTASTTGFTLIARNASNGALVAPSTAFAVSYVAIGRRP
jgi:hypothetical protein